MFDTVDPPRSTKPRPNLDDTATQLEMLARIEDGRVVSPVEIRGLFDVELGISNLKKCAQIRELTSART